MDEQDRLAQRFETHRGHLRAVAYRMLGSLGEADDAVQEAWLRLSRSDTGAVDNLAGWLTTVVARLCLDMLRSRAARREHPVGSRLPERAEPFGTGVGGTDPAHEAQQADAAGRALLVVLDRLAPAERVVVVLHDVFAVPFDEIAPIVARSPAAAKKLAGRARRKVRGADAVPAGALVRHRRVVEAFLAAVRDGDIDALLEVLAPDVVRRAEPAALPPGVATEIRGARDVAEEARLLSRERVHVAEPVLVNGRIGAVVAPHGRLLLALTFTIADEKIAGFEVIADPDRLRLLDLALVDDQGMFAGGSPCRVWR
ncbi:sigma-70 family RNA polymerase sigma factor [Pseudonocardia xinjiangensis]|uniref:sigma-70 family RNA polymerase sigma factor n=1 Tax=Pseudonocardia xinjiangensis TaxID=75289 RepID=UPI003D8AC45D